MRSSVSFAWASSEAKRDGNLSAISTFSKRGATHDRDDGAADGIGRAHLLHYHVTAARCWLRLTNEQQKWMRMTMSTALKTYTRP